MRDVFLNVRLEIAAKAQGLVPLPQANGMVRFRDIAKPLAVGPAQLLYRSVDIGNRPVRFLRVNSGHVELPLLPSTPGHARLSRMDFLSSCQSAFAFSAAASTKGQPRLGSYG